MGPYDERRASEEKTRRVWGGRNHLIFRSFPLIESLEQANSQSAGIHHQYSPIFFRERGRDSDVSGFLPFSGRKASRQRF